MKAYRTAIALLATVALWSLGTFGLEAKDDKAGSISITSKSFAQGATIPKNYTGEGKDVSPELTWGNAPANTKSFAITCEDPNAPGGRWFHWIIFNIPPQTHNLKEGVEKSLTLKDGSAQGTNDFGKPGYNGPMPPEHAGPHHYQFIIFALDNKLPLKAGCTKRDFYSAAKGHVLARGSVIGLYQR